MGRPRLPFLSEVDLPFPQPIYQRARGFHAKLTNEQCFRPYQQPGGSQQREGPHSRIVLSSRVRLARNVKDLAFPGWAKKPERVEALKSSVPRSKVCRKCKAVFAESMDNLTALDKQILVERHLISREHAAKSAGSGLVLNKDETLCVMINEEDHLRMQALRPGLQLKQAWQAIDQFDSELEKKLDYAFSPDLGYLTACPTNLGTGIRVSAMLHLPGAGAWLSRSTRSFRPLTNSGLAVRGLYGEGTEALGNIFQVSNQMTLGEVETDIVERLNKVLAQIIEHEENARASLPREEAQDGLQPYRPRLRHSGQRPQHLLEGDDEPPFAHAARRGSRAVSRHEAGWWTNSSSPPNPPICKSNSPKNSPPKSAICSERTCCATACATSAAQSGESALQRHAEDRGEGVARFPLTCRVIAHSPLEL